MGLSVRWLFVRARAQETGEQSAAQKNHDCRYRRVFCGSHAPLAEQKHPAASSFRVVLTVSFYCVSSRGRSVTVQ